jgi:aspartokinase/homoserine dehydrogenase 1
MQVLKFGGTSVASAESMTQCCDIIKKAVEKDRTIVIASAISKCTDTLIKIGRLAAQKDETYKNLIDSLQERHHEIIRRLLPQEKQEESLQTLDGTFDYLKGIALYKDPRHEIGHHGDTYQMD